MVRVGRRKTKRSPKEEKAISRRTPWLDKTERPDVGLGARVPSGAQHREDRPGVHVTHLRDRVAKTHHLQIRKLRP